MELKFNLRAMLMALTSIRFADVLRQVLRRKLLEKYFKMLRLFAQLTVDFCTSIEHIFGGRSVRTHQSYDLLLFDKSDAILCGRRRALYAEFEYIYTNQKNKHFFDSFIKMKSNTAANMMIIKQQTQ